MEKVRNWVGKKVVCVEPERESSPTRRKLLKIGQVYEVEDVSVGNYWACIRLKGMPETVYSEYSRKDVPVCFDWRAFQLVEELEEELEEELVKELEEELVKELEEELVEEEDERGKSK